MGEGMIGPMDIYVDLFAGGGGTSCGVEMAMGFSPDIAVNHSPEAIAMHTANHPGTKHYQTDVWEVDPVEVCAGRPVGMLWASPDCTHFSKAKGGKPKSHKIRSLAWVVVRWAKEVRPKVILLENVEEFKTWGPLDEYGQPIKALAGETFTHFVDSLHELGYQVEYRELRACDYGAPTIRKRLFLIARCDGDPIVWPVKTHGPGTGRPYRTAAECIDWRIPCPSIFGRRIPLKPNTLRRIAKGVLRYVIHNPHPYIVKTDSCAESQRDKFALVSAFLSQYHGEQNKNEVRGQALSEPIMCVDGSNRYGLCAVTLLKNYGGVIGQKADSPAGTITAVDHHSLVACSLMRQFGTSNAADIENPLGTVMPHGRGKTGLIAAFLDKYYGTGGGSDLSEPMPTATSKDRLSLVTVKIDGELYAISDIGMRMLQPRELFRAQGFPEDYTIDLEFNGRPLPKSAQVKLCGNSVCPPVAAAIIGANCRAVAQKSAGAA
ncbi:MAG: DNA cytosine methyltransferase [Synergistes sp.]|nr:DNA cytosine methyltransferase [Synergistes sp.]